MANIKACAAVPTRSRWTTSWSWKLSSWCSRKPPKNPAKALAHFWKSARPILYACARSMHRALAMKRLTK